MFIIKFFYRLFMIVISLLYVLLFNVIVFLVKVNSICSIIKWCCIKYIGIVVIFRYWEKEVEFFIMYKFCFECILIYNV